MSVETTDQFPSLNGAFNGGATLAKAVDEEGQIGRIVWVTYHRAPPGHAAGILALSENGSMKGGYPSWYDFFDWIFLSFAAGRFNAHLPVLLLILPARRPVRLKAGLNRTDKEILFRILNGR